jgi:hypothetical protein
MAVPAGFPHPGAAERRAVSRRARGLRHDGNEGGRGGRPRPAGPSMAIAIQTKVRIALVSITLTWLLTARATVAPVCGPSLLDEAFPLIAVAGLLGAMIATRVAG